MKNYQREGMREPLGKPVQRSAKAIALAACLVATVAWADQPKKTTPPPVAPATPAPAAKPPAAQLNSPLNFNSLKPNNAATPRPAPANPLKPATPNRTPQPNISNQKFIPGPAVASHTFPGHPGPPGSSEAPGRNGSVVRKAADGSVLDVRNARTGVSVHHALDGSRQITVERPDHSRVVIPARGIQYVQHPYMYKGQQMVNRTLVVQGQTFHQVYRSYKYGNNTLDVYATSRYFAPNYYQWARSPFKAPQNFNWTYTTNAAPWYGHYRSYFTPERSYQTPAAWLTDYMLAATLFVAYAAKDESADPPPANAAPITPEIKRGLSNEVARQVDIESSEAQQNANNAEPAAATGSVVQLLADHQPHMFLVSSGLDLVDSTGRRCSMSEGDVVSVLPTNIQPDTSTLAAIVQSNKGGTECGRSAQVQLALDDVQEMQNHMREAIDQGLANTKAAEQAQSVVPAFAAAVPPADANAANEIKQQQEIAAAAEG